MEKSSDTNSKKFGDLSDAEIDKNFRDFRDLLQRATEGSKRVSLLLMVDTLGQHLALAPASSRLDYHSCHVGGLVEHSLRVWRFATQELQQPSQRFYNELSFESITLVSLLHDIGKCAFVDGDSNVIPYYVPNESDSSFYAQKTGKMYEINPLLKNMHMSVPHRGLYMLQHFGVKLSAEEFLGIMLHDGQFDETNKYYSMKEPDLAVFVHMADLLATRYEKDLYNASKR